MRPRSASIGFTPLVGFALPGGVAARMDAARRSFRRWPCSASRRVPTVAIDVYNTQDVWNRAPGPGFRWTVLRHARRARRPRLDQDRHVQERARAGRAGRARPRHMGIHSGVRRAADGLRAAAVDDSAGQVRKGERGDPPGCISRRAPRTAYDGAVAPLHRLPGDRSARTDKLSRSSSRCSTRTVPVSFLPSATAR